MCCFRVPYRLQQSTANQSIYQYRIKTAVLICDVVFGLVNTSF